MPPELPTWEPWFAILAAIGLLVGMARRWGPPDVLALAVLGSIMAAGELTGTRFLPSPGDAIKGFGSSGLLTVGFLFVVVAGLESTGASELAFGWLLRRPKSLLDAQIRVLTPTAVISGFLNNTPVVAAMIPIAGDLAKRMQISPSRLYLPISYAAVMGGLCTIMGTSTNLVVNDMLKATGTRSIGFFEIGWVGVPATIIGLLYIFVFSRWLLPDRRPAVSVHDDPRQYTVEMIVQPSGPLVGRTIEDAGLRHLPGLFLTEIQRGDSVIRAVSPRVALQSNDLLVFVGVLESVVDLQKIRGLATATDQTTKLNVPAWHRGLVEAVVSTRCPLLGKSIREGRFRTHYRAAVIAVARGGERIAGKLGDVVLQSGDVLLLEASPAFVSENRDSPDFFLVSAVQNSIPRRHERAWWALGIMCAMVLAAAVSGSPAKSRPANVDVSAKVAQVASQVAPVPAVATPKSTGGESTTWLTLTTASLLAAIAMIALRCCTLTEARQAVDWSVLIVIGSTLGIGLAIDRSGAAKMLADALIGLAGDRPLLILAAVYVATMLCTEMITNNAAAALMFPLSYNAAVGAQLDPVPFAIAVMVAASAGFSTPFGYQTNLMVYGPGGYRASDYFRFGSPLNLIVMAVALIVIKLVWL